MIILSKILKEIREESNPQSGKAAPYGSGYKPVKELVTDTEVICDGYGWNADELIYHFSYPSAILSILESDKMYAKNLDGNEKLSISFTKNIDFWKKGISGFRPARKGAFLAIDPKKLEKDKIPLSGFEFKGIKNFNYNLEEEVRAYPASGEIKIKKYLMYVGLTKYSEKEEFFTNKLKKLCNDKNIKLISV